jgi:hypothetical protein
MPQTYDSIASETLSSAQATITFSNISGSYTDLILVMQGRHETGGVNRDIYLRYNQDTNANYSSTRLSATGNGTPTSDRLTSTWTSIWSGYWYSDSSSDFSTSIIQIQNYSNTTTFKTCLTRQYAVNHNSQWATVGCWRSTSAITRIDITVPSASFASGSTFTLYGIKAA